MNMLCKGAFLFLGLLLATLDIYMCPTCVGKVSKNSPPFFSDEFYQPSPKQDLPVDFITTNSNPAS